MKRYKKPLICLLLGSLIMLLSFDGLMKLEILNFIGEPYFLIFMSGFTLVFIALFWLFVLLLQDLKKLIKSKLFKK